MRDVQILGSGKDTAILAWPELFRILFQYLYFGKLSNGTSRGKFFVECNLEIFKTLGIPQACLPFALVHVKE